MQKNVGFEKLSERHYISGILLITIFYLWQNYRNRIVYRDFDKTTLHESLSYLELLSNYIQPLAFILLFLATFSALTYLVYPSALSLGIVAFSAFILLGLTTHSGKINHNTNFFIYILIVIFTNDIYSKKYGSKSTLRNIPLIFLAPFFLAGCYKISQMYGAYMSGNFGDDYGHSMILNLMILKEAWLIGKLSYLASMIVKYSDYTFPLFFIGVTFQVAALPLAFVFQKRIWIFGIFFLSFNLFSGMIIGAFFAETFLLGLFVLFLYPNNEFIDLDALKSLKKKLYPKA